MYMIQRFRYCAAQNIREDNSMRPPLSASLTLDLYAAIMEDAAPLLAEKREQKVKDKVEGKKEHG